uniref:C2H2-type domain-containing protein n=1 Tax=Graphocephala atropunctata TaxID=36148 RepID=A0A1B6LBI7_9HEMI
MSRSTKISSHFTCPKCHGLFSSLVEFNQHTCKTDRDSVNFVCEDCGRTFKRLRNFQNHRNHHDVESGKFFCEVCGQQFSRKDQYDQHTNVCESGLNFQCPLCSVKYSKKELLNHFKTNHSIQLKVESKFFPSFKEFEVWKTLYEKEYLLIYRKKAEYVRGDGWRALHLSCNGGNTPLAGDLHSFDSNKSTGWCPSEIKADVSKRGDVLVSFTTTHVGHTVCHNIQQQSENDSECNSDVSSKNRGNKSIEKERKTKLLPQDLELWVEEKAHVDCVRYFKRLGHRSPEYPELLEPGRYFLLLMTKVQADLLKTCSEKCICVDRKNGNSFELITLLVIDDTDQCFPCAFLFTNKSDMRVMEVFFTEIKNAVGVLTPKVFMSDKTKLISAVWKNVMGSPDKDVYCSWDVLRDWKSNLCILTDKERQFSIYKALKGLMEETDIWAFKTMLELIIYDLENDPETADFGLFITENYSGSVESWGPCFLIKEGINSNFQLEGMQTIIQNILQSKIAGKINKTLDAVLNFLKSKIYDRLVLLSKGQTSCKLLELQNKHKFAEKLNFQVSYNGEYWIVLSGKKDQNKVMITSKNCGCSLKCNSCNVCSHAYTCTCYDSTVRLNMCKHIHSVCINEASGSVTLCEEISLESSPSPLDGSDQSNEFDDNFNTQQETLVVNISEETESTEAPKEEALGDGEVSVVECDPNVAVEFVHDDYDTAGEVFATEEILPSSAENIDLKKANLELLFKSILDESDNERQLEVIQSEIISLKNKLLPLNLPCDASSKKREVEEVEILNTSSEQIIYQYCPNPTKKQRN